MSMIDNAKRKHSWRDVDNEMVNLSKTSFIGKSKRSKSMIVVSGSL